MIANSVVQWSKFRKTHNRILISTKKFGIRITDYNKRKCFRSGSGSRRVKMTHKERKKLRKFTFWSAGCSLLMNEGFSCSLDVLFRGLGVSELHFFSSIFGHKNPGSGLDPDSTLLRGQALIRSGETLASGGKLLISCWMAGSMALVGPSCFSRSWIYEWQDSSTTVSCSTCQNILTTVIRIRMFSGLQDPYR